MSSFAAALESNPAPRLLGDVTLRYDSSMLIGETPRGKAGARSTVVWIVGVALLLFLAGGLILQWELSLLVPLLACGAAAIGLAVWLERLEKRQRRFVANFGTVSLRLDFTSPIAGKPRTLVVPFDAVKAAALLRQVDGASCLCVDFTLGQELLREVLVAHIPDAQRPQAERLERVLRGAFGLGEVPPDSPLFGTQWGQGEPTSDKETSSFE